ncbi:EAL and HDOD domain-containing protein [Niallia nealsonii]|uniref:EAL and HDOD domain-containing protein n=1 Tax=Niallia nealsonii TaxID=115979 RepID=UPI001F3E4FFC|nr:HDOD domain-containing protein [Niallia nealsonii]
MPTYIHTYFEIIKNISAKEPDIEIIANLIEQNVSLSYKLLKLVNTLGCGSQYKVNGIRQAIVLLGFIELKKWLCVLAVREKDSSNGISGEVMKLCLVRAKICEEVAKLLPVGFSLSGYFLTGMFSLMDRILNLSMSEVLNQLPLDKEIEDALNGKRNDQRKVLDLVFAVEKVQWQTISAFCKGLMIKEKDVFNAYGESLNWAKQMIEEN